MRTTFNNAYSATRGTSVAGDDWRAEASCRDHDAELWFPVGYSGPAQEQLKAAVSICRACPVQQRCLSWVLETGADRGYGVWAATTEQERRDLRKDLGLASPPPPSEALRNAAEDLLAGSTIDDVVRRYGLSRNRAEELSAEVRREAKRAGRTA